MSKLKLQVAMVNNDVLKEARESQGFSGYTGPTPPPGEYDLKLSTILYDQYQAGGSLAGKDRLSAIFEIQDEQYKGANVRSTYTIPFDPEHEHFQIHISTLDRFMLAVTDGEMDIQDFVKAANEDRIIVEDTKSGKAKRVTQIGKFKVDKAAEVNAMTKNRVNGDRTYTDVHYFNGPRLKNAEGESQGDDTDDLDLDLDLDDDLDI